MDKAILLKLIFLMSVFTMISCSSSNITNTNAPLENTRWILKSLNGSKITQGTKEVYIEFKSAENRVNGNGGCNNYFGSYTKNGSSLKIGPVARTEMFCEGKMDVENALVTGLEKTIKYKVRLNTLELYDADKLFATFTKYDFQ